MAAIRKILKDPAVQAAAAAGLLAAGRALMAKRREIDLRGQVVLITGGSRGLGLAMAREFAREGCRLALCARNPEELERARADLEARGAEVIAIPCDITVRTQVEQMMTEATERFGRVDILVNNAGVISTGPVETMVPQDFEDALDVMFWGMVFATWAALPQIRARKSGRIVNITSIGGKVSVPHLLPYSVAKFAAVGLSEGLHAEMAKDGVTVTTVVPGLMRTGSPVRATMKGQFEKEYILFAAMDNQPLFSISAETAARSIVRATKRGDAEIVLSPQASLLALFHGLFPGLTADILGLVNRALPDAEPGRSERRLGLDIQHDLKHPRLADPMGLGRAAAERYNEVPDQAMEETEEVSAPAS